MRFRSRFTGCAAAALLLTGAAASAGQLDWQAVVGPDTDDRSEFVAVEAQVAADAGGVARAYLAGNFNGNFTTEDDAEGGIPGAYEGAVVSCLSDGGDSSWPVTWRSYVGSGCSVRLNDLAIEPGSGTIWVCGSYCGDMCLPGTATVFSRPAGPHGFVARLDPEDGSWLGAFETLKIDPRSIAVDGNGGVYVTGPGVLLAKVDGGTGAVEWVAPANPMTWGWAHVALRPGPLDPFVYVMAWDGGDPNSQDVLVGQFHRAGGVPGWSLRMGSQGGDRPGGLDVGKDGDLRLSFASADSVPCIDGVAVPDVPAVSATYTVVARVGADRSVRWVRVVGGLVENKPATMISTDLDLDAQGNAWLAARCDKQWTIQGVRENMKDDVALIGIDGAGELFGFCRSSGMGDDVPLAVSAPTRDLAMVAGCYRSRQGSEYEPGLRLPGHNDEPGRFLAIARPTPRQELYVFRPAPQANLTVEQFTDLLGVAGVQVYTVGDDGAGGIVVSGYATDSQVNDLAGNPELSFEQEVALTPNGMVTDAGWGLARANDGGNAAPPEAVQPYFFRETTEPVLLYLIDTAVANPNDWFGGNANLTLEKSILIRGAGDPTESGEFEHGTRMASLVAGPETGAAVGTPVRLINYDIYPSGGATTSALMAKAVIEAVRHHKADPAGDSGVICIASSSGAGATSSTLRFAVDLAVAEGLTVVVSAGNHGGDVSRYIPASYGADAGIICVGASDCGNQPLAMSNRGAAVDLFAPGQAVRALRFSDPVFGEYDEMSGTSPAAALGAAAALIELSGSPGLSPAAVEGALLADLYPAAVGLVQIDPQLSAFEGWAFGYGIVPADPGGDPDRDGIVNLMEYLHGCNPVVMDRELAGLAIVQAAGGITVEIEVDQAHIDPAEVPGSVVLDPGNPMQLPDGSGWQLESSPDLETWTPVGGTLAISSPSGGRIPLSWSLPTGDSRCFVRIRLMPAE